MPVGFLQANRAPLRAHEHLLVFSRRKSASLYVPQTTPCKPYVSRTGSSTKVYRRFTSIRHVRNCHHPRSVFYPVQPQRSANIHPTEKPLELLRWMINSHTRRGDLVIDPYSGSGVTAVACQELGRRFLGAEADRTYHARAMRRLALQANHAPSRGGMS